MSLPPDSEASSPVARSPEGEASEARPRPESARDESSDAASMTLERGAAIGRYTVLERIGAGGMGVVYAAFDPQLDRRVALKVMHPRRRTTTLAESTGKSRLLREAQAIAKLSHPNVITVHDVGTYGDRVFVAMEFIEGTTLRSWLRHAERDWEEVVDAFVRAGRGLAAAHAAGLVHRDFKPDNVLMGSDGRVLVMDFGLARQEMLPTQSIDPEATTSGGLVAEPEPEPESGVMLTRTGALMGTPAYMAPEQHRNMYIGPHSDQFSFCVSLYEGLYGERPFGGNSRTAVAMHVLEGRVRPAPREAKVPAWLRSVVLRGLSVDPADRFPSMDALLAELQRDPPQTTRPWVTLGVTAGVTAFIVLAYFASRPPADETCRNAAQEITQAWNDESRELVARALLSDDVPYAQTSWQSVRESLDDFAQTWTSTYQARCEARAADSLPGADSASTHPELACLQTHRIAFEALLTAYVEFHEQATEHAVEAAQALPPVATCMAGADLVRPASTPTRSRLIRGVATASALLATGQHIAAVQQATPLVERAAGAEPDLEAEAALIVAQAHTRLGDHRAADDALRRAVLAAAVAGRGDLEANAWVRLVEIVGLRDGLPEEGRRLALAADAAVRRVGDPPRLRADLRMRLGTVALEAGQYELAFEQFERALELRRNHLPPGDLSIADAREGAGLAAEGLGRFEHALEEHQAALTLREQELGTSHPRVGRSLVRIGAAMIGIHRNDAAEAALVRARMLLDPTEIIAVDDLAAPDEKPPTEPPSDDELTDGPTLATVFDLLGHLRRSEQKFEEAAQLHARAAALLEGELGADHRDVGYPTLNLGLALSDLGRHDEALHHLRRALEIWKNSLEPLHPDLGLAHLALGNALGSAGAVSEAQVHYAAALAGWQEALPEDHPLLAYAMTGLGRVHLQSDDVETAIALLERALEIRDHEHEDALNLAETSLLLGRALWRDGSNTTRALELVVRARELVGALEPSQLAGLERVLGGGQVPRFTDQLGPAGLLASDRRLRPR